MSTLKKKTLNLSRLLYFVASPHPYSPEPLPAAKEPYVSRKALALTFESSKPVKP